MIVLHPGGIMRRFDGQPYSDGARLRCADCNGFFDGVCLTCGAAPRPMRPQTVRSISMSATHPVCSTCGQRIYYHERNRIWQHNRNVDEWHRPQPITEP